MPLGRLAQAQQADDSPYSSYGFGDLPVTSQVVQALMGGTSIASTDPASVALVNPASYASLAQPCFEIGVIGRRVALRTDAQQQVRSGAKLMGFSLGLPFGKGRWGLALGLAPVSDVGYRITDQGTLPDGSNVRFVYEGSGGINRAHVGVGHAIWQRRDEFGNGLRLTAGATFNYLFGTIDRIRKAYYPTGQNFLNTSVVSSLVVRDPLVTLGVQLQGHWRRRISKDDPQVRWVVGAFAEPDARLGARRDEFISSFGVSSAGVEVLRDTISFTSGARGAVTLPLAWGLGGAIAGPQWTLTAEMRRRDWSRLRVEVQDYRLTAEVADGATYAVGASWNPLGGRNGAFLGRATYRAGARYTQDYLVVKGSQLEEFGIVFGTSLPVMGSLTRSRFSIGAELGRRGTTDNGALQEDFINVLVGLTITPDIRENWFKKRRIE